MCLAALALGVSPRFPLVMATNRDEFHARPAAPMAWWSSALTRSTPVLAGQDLQAGGGWMGMTTQGRWGLLTNVRRPQHQTPPQAPSRGQIVPAWLASPHAAESFVAARDWQDHAPFNLLAGDLAGNRVLWFSNDAQASGPKILEPGVHGLSNALLNTPWPKVTALKAALTLGMGLAQSQAWATDTLASWLLTALTDTTPAPDHALPRTGIALELERTLSSVFIDDTARGYGTRCSTVLIAERESEPVGASSGAAAPLRLLLVERTHAPHAHECWHRLMLDRA